MRRFLGNTLNIFLTKKRFDVFWEVIDGSLDGEVSWFELFLFVFPQYRSDIMKELGVIIQFRKKLKLYFLKLRILETHWESHIRSSYLKYFENNIDLQQFGEFLNLFQISFDREDAKLLFTVIDAGNTGSVAILDILKTIDLSGDFKKLDISSITSVSRQM